MTGRDSMSLALLFAVAALLQVTTPSQFPVGPQTGNSGLHGSVRAADGSPIEGVRIVVTCNFAHTPTAAAETGADGGYLIQDLPAGNCGVLATKPGYVAASGPNGPLGPVTAQGQMREGAATEVDLRMTRGADVSGRVVNQQGAPMARAAVLLMRRDVRGGQAVFGTVGPQGVGRTDANGEFHIRGMEGGVLYVCATIPNIVHGQPPAGDLNGCYGSQGMQQASPVSLRLGEAVTGIDFSIAPGPRFQTVPMMP